MTDRFEDGGTYLGAFASSFDVRCPACGGRAIVQARHGERAARVTCTGCAYATTEEVTGWQGPTRGTVHGRCHRCGQRLARTLAGPRHDHPAHLTCACGAASDHEITWHRLADGAVDPVFGLELWLHEPVKGEVLWAYNAEHLEFLKGYVGADLRERAPNRNASLASRLPPWMKSAKNRDAVVAAIRKLEARASRG